MIQSQLCGAFKGFINDLSLPCRQVKNTFVK